MRWGHLCIDRVAIFIDLYVFVFVLILLMLSRTLKQHDDRDTGSGSRKMFGKSAVLGRIRADSDCQLCNNTATSPVANISERAEGWMLNLGSNLINILILGGLERWVIPDGLVPFLIVFLPTHIQPRTRNAGTEAPTVYQILILPRNPLLTAVWIK